MADNAQSPLVFSGAFHNVAEIDKGLRHLLVDHQIRLVTDQQHPFLPVPAHLLPAVGQQVKILRPLDAVAGFL